MKDSLFGRLDEANREVGAAAAAVRRVHESRSQYNVLVPRERVEKKRYVKGWKCTHHKTIVHKWDEVVFDQRRFDEDLANANSKLNESSSKLLNAKRAVQDAIQRASDTVRHHDDLVAENRGLKQSVANSKAKLSHLSTYNVSSEIARQLQQRNNLEYQKNKAGSEVNSLPSKINQKHGEISASLSNLQANTAVQKKQEQDTLAAKSALRDKIAGLDETQRAKLLYKMVNVGNTEFLSVLEQFKCWTEFAAYIAVEKGDMKVFDYCLNRGIDADSFINEESTLALHLVKMGRLEYLQKLFSYDAGVSLCTTAYTAFLEKDYVSLKCLLGCDAGILRKIKDVVGLSAVQIAIDAGDIEQIRFIKDHDAAGLQENILGYKSGLDMALCYNNSEIIRYLLEGRDCVSELGQLIASGELSKFEILMGHVEVQQTEAKGLYEQAVGLGAFAMSEILLNKIEDVTTYFEDLVIAGKMDVAADVACLCQEKIGQEYVGSLISKYNDGTTSGVTTLKILQDISDLLGDDLSFSDDLAGNANDDYVHV